METCATVPVATVVCTLAWLAVRSTMCSPSAEQPVSQTPLTLTMLAFKHYHMFLLQGCSVNQPWTDKCLVLAACCATKAVCCSCRDNKQKWELFAACLQHLRLVVQALRPGTVQAHAGTQAAVPPGLTIMLDLLRKPLTQLMHPCH